MSLSKRLTQVRDQLDSAITTAGRPPHSVQLLAVSKTHPPDAIRELFAQGQTAFGENYCQEAREKQRQLSDLAIEWHFIGPIQSNKTREIAEHFTWVHTVDRLKIAQRLSEQRPESLPPLNLCLQVNIDNEATKAGVSVAELPALVAAINELPRLQLRGLMAIPAPREDYQQQLQAFQRLAAAAREFPTMDTLSMGMSADMTAAVAAGSTLVRIGTGIFGPRSR